ncbi:MAG: aldo/keto reductase [Rhodospirillum sp.]|nr:aldo/keto reductase [Rhodospirillum sp.]MCF8490508.1 aldo/keto reductase [Rhodospirillum sp.]MCF8500635.1 aldo/keto reductase [Rhodospirillum sp.]
MHYNQLGQSGLFVSELCLGTMTFGGGEGIWGAIGALQQRDANAMVKTALDAGVNFIDTANVYSAGLSERITGQALKDLGIPRDEVVVATKVLGPMGTGPNARGAGRGHIMDQVDASLTRLGLDYIDLYQIHGFDNATSIEETLTALTDLVRSGKVRYIGLSNWAAWRIMKGIGITQARGLAPIASLQAYYSLAGRELEREVVPLLTSEGLGLMVWSPLAGGFLSGKYTRETDGAVEGRRARFDFPPVDKERTYDVVDVLAAIAKDRGVSLAAVALGWLLHQPAVSSVIIGATRPEQLTDNLTASALTLTAGELERIGAASALKPEYPGWMLERQGEYRQGQSRVR